MTHEETVLKNHPGYKGEKYVELWAESKGYRWEKASREDNYIRGIDYRVNGIECDVKNSKYIFFAKYNLLRDFFSVRHPFRTETMAENYVLIKDVDEDTTKVIYFGPIQDYLIEHYFKNEMALKNFKRVINNYDFSSFKTHNLKTIDEFSIKLSDFLKKYLKEGIKISFLKQNELNLLRAKDDKNEICYKLIKNDL